MRRGGIALFGIVLACAACRLSIPGVIPGTVCDADARTDDVAWWRGAEPLKAMDRVTKALRLKVEVSDRASALREKAEAAAGECRKRYFDGYAAAHAAVEKANADLDAFKLGRPRSAYDPELAQRSFSTYCDAAYEIELFVSAIDNCIK